MSRPSSFAWDDDEPIEELDCLEARARYALSAYQLQGLVVAGLVRRPWVGGRPVIVITPMAHAAMSAANSDEAP